MLITSNDHSTKQNMIKWRRKCVCRSISNYFSLLCKLSSDAQNSENALIDYLEVFVQGGNGGMGCASIQHLQKSKTKPDGGEGGNGGSVLFKCSSLKHDFNHISSEIIGQTGGHGTSRNRKGIRGQDTIIDVPVGSIIGSQQSQKPLIELNSDEEVYMAAIGGVGGKGNQNLSSEMAYGTRKFTCRDKEDGGVGKIAELYLEMKVIADIGLVGLPNAGKSSLLRAISAAKPKVASYPFTTMRPHIGVIHYDRYYRLTMADIPGLIEGSSLGYGLGISFLKHIERCISLLYVVDMADADHRPIETIGILEKELESYKFGMTERITGIVANKVDLLRGPETIIELAQAFPNYPVIPISANKQRNIVSVRKVLEPFKKLYIGQAENEN